MRQLFFLIFLLPTLPAFSQGKDTIYKVFTHSLSIEASQPLGEFSETHRLGIRLHYINNGSRVKKLKTRPSCRSGFIYGGGLGWQPGKKEAVNGYEYEYGDLFYGFVSGGISYQVKKDWEFNITAGPALSLYASTNRFNIYAGLQTTYVISPLFGARAGIHLLKETRANAIAMTALGLAYVF